MENWIILNENEYDLVWTAFENKYKFDPSVYQKDWPSITIDSDDYITYELNGTWDEANDLDEICLENIKKIILKDEYIYALDWQHESYKFNPNLPIENDKWIIPFYPNGDYYIFFPKDMRWCYFGHPWEQSITLIGKDIIREFENVQPKIFGNILRKK
jgi:hypothetical protein